ncbi:HAD family hydrolase [Rosettibacter firmus]|uniref:HAD family hydrolase n=1 Tax=Rosettibacter firmus TaxID=3111522 RepID=UPI00336BE901
MKNYSVIVFDLGNVLIPFDYGRIINKLNSIEDGLGFKFANLYKEHYEFHRNFERGLVSREEFLNTMLDWTDHKINPDEFCKIYSDIFSLNENVISLIPVLKKNYTVLLLSNTNEIHEEYGYRHYEFLKYFDKIFLSYKVGAVKPEEKIYKAVETFSQKPSSEHLFIDDIPDYVEGAKKCGWDGIVFQNYEQLVNDLKLRNIILDGIN